MNQVTLIGNLTKDPELRSIPSGTSVCNFSLAVNEKIRGEDKAHFFEIVTWSKTAENCNQYITKGSKVAISGQLQQQRWQNKEGQNRSKVVINAKMVEFLNVPKQKEKVVNIEKDETLGEAI